MRAFLRATVVVAWFWSSSLAFATAFRDGNHLLRDCSRPDTIEFAFCLGYVDAITDVLEAGNSVNGYRACVPVGPGGVEAFQLKDIVVQYLRRNPSPRHLGAAGLVAGAISEAFPCR